MELEDTLKNITNTLLEDYPELFLIELKIKGHEGGQRVKVIVDGEPSVNIDDCAEISRKLGFQIEEQELIADKFVLEVTSPGIDHPLQLPRQYYKNVGRNVRIKTEDGNEFEGELKWAEKDELKVIESKSKKELNLNLKEIKQTNVLVSFN